ncbi:MAG: hypothetical protein HY340_00005 [Candidatus Kerfeldbacteria bacterium]|nr:hypothetical protein [Candidatus Kerfeldbacteria bacterium]
MKIIRDNPSATLTLVPVEADEEQVIASIAAILKPEDKLSYGGRGRDGDDDRFCTVHLHAGSREEERIETGRNVTIHRTVHVGGVELVLRGSTEEDKHEVGSIRDMCYFGSGGLIFIGMTEVDGKKAIVTIGKRCQHCGAGMTRFTECEWNTCDACAAKCEHNYVRGMIHGGGTDMGVGEYCDRCGRGKPKAEGEREKSVIEHHLAVEKELGVTVIYKDGFPNTPRQAVEVGRLARRYAKSRRRAAQ